MDNNSDKVILSLCGGTGSWEAPYVKAGYTVHNITWPDYDLKRTEIGTWGTNEIGFYPPYPKELDFGEYPTLTIDPKNVYGILAAPPCTQFSDARTNAKTPRNLAEGMELVNICISIIQYCQYCIESEQSKKSPLRFWALENPWYGRLKWFLGKPAFVFDPWEFGDPHKKKTALWGLFNDPVKTHTNVLDVMTPEQLAKSKTNSRDLGKSVTNSVNQTRSALRAMTPPGFAQGFFEANP